MAETVNMVLLCKLVAESERRRVGTLTHKCLDVWNKVIRSYPFPIDQHTVTFTNACPYYVSMLIDNLDAFPRHISHISMGVSTIPSAAIEVTLGEQGRRTAHSPKAILEYWQQRLGTHKHLCKCHKSGSLCELGTAIQEVILICQRGCKI